MITMTSSGLKMYESSTPAPLTTANTLWSPFTPSCSYHSKFKLHTLTPDISASTYIPALVSTYFPTHACCYDSRVDLDWKLRAGTMSSFSFCNTPRTLTAAGCNKP